MVVGYLSASKIFLHFQRQPVLMRCAENVAKSASGRGDPHLTNKIYLNCTKVLTSYRAVNTLLLGCIQKSGLCRVNIAVCSEIHKNTQMHSLGRT